MLVIQLKHHWKALAETYKIIPKLFQILFSIPFRELERGEVGGGGSQNDCIMFAKVSNIIPNSNFYGTNSTMQIFENCVKLA